MVHTTLLSNHGSTSKGPEPIYILELLGPYLLILHESHLPVPWGFQAKYALATWLHNSYSPGSKSDGAFSPLAMVSQFTQGPMSRH